MYVGKLEIKPGGNIYYDGVPLVMSGKINATAITGFDALNVSKIADGTLSWNGFKSATSPSINPFASVGTPLVTI